LDAEKYLLSVCERSAMRAIVLRAGVIYGRGIKLIEAAHWLARKRLLAVWRKPTWIHLLALADFLKIIEIAIANDSLSGIYNIADDQPLLLQEFLQRLTEYWGEPGPWRLPEFTFLWTATLAESAAALMRRGTPLTCDMIKMAMTSVVADTSRMKREILPALAYPTLTEGLKAL
jgi:nucleoside-diphosphate-sugar epimerase